MKEFELYKAEAKLKWGGTEAYAEYEERTKGDSREKTAALAEGLDSILGAFAACMKNGSKPDSADAQTLVKTLQNYITEHFYTCTDHILAGLGQMYVADERFKINIDRHADGTAEFIRAAIHLHCNK